MPQLSGDPGVDTGAERAETAAPRYVVVPLSPGPLTHLHTGAGGDGDDIDAALDELFGDIADEQPGRFDLALIAVGAASITWWLVSGATGPGLVFGGIALVLGLALPARNALRIVNRRWTRALDRRQLRRGHALEIGSPAVAGLVLAYEQLVALRRTAGDEATDEVLGPAHQAVVEVASLLGSNRPTAKAEIDYVQKRGRAVRAVAASLKRASSKRDQARLAEALEDRETRERWATAVAEAREQLDAATGLGSLEQLDALTRRIDVEAGPPRAD